MAVLNNHFLSSRDPTIYLLETENIMGGCCECCECCEYCAVGLLLLGCGSVSRSLNLKNDEEDCLLSLVVQYKR